MFLGKEERKGWGNILHGENSTLYHEIDFNVVFPARYRLYRYTHIPLNNTGFYYISLTKRFHNTDIIPYSGKKTLLCRWKTLVYRDADGEFSNI